MHDKLKASACCVGVTVGLQSVIRAVVLRVEPLFGTLPCVGPAGEAPPPPRLYCLYDCPCRPHDRLSNPGYTAAGLQS